MASTRKTATTVKKRKPSGTAGQETGQADPFVAIRSRLSDHEKQELIEYRVHSSSGWSPGYHPDNILIDAPTDQASRWSSPANDHSQFLMLELVGGAKGKLISAITFGKFHKLHVCNLREFKLLVGPTEDLLVEVLHSGLRNDSDPETFTLDYSRVHNGKGVELLPVRFVKIVPLAAHGSSFNYSIWFVALRGISDPQLVEAVEAMWTLARERDAWRVCLQHIRANGFPCEAASLQEKTGYSIEDPLLSQIYTLVTTPDGLSRAETLISETPREVFEELEPGEFARGLRVSWQLLKPPGPKPSKRGGHQVAYDPVTSEVWLYGGWDGSQELGDLWSYSYPANAWRLVQEDCRQKGGPGPRSCHKIVIDPDRRLLYVMGRFVEPDQRAVQPLASELFALRLDEGKWQLLAEDTAADGGPPLLYDHHMAVDPLDGSLLVFGGKAVTAGTAGGEAQYAGLWRCRFAKGQCVWEQLRPDTPDQQPVGSPLLRSRIGHCMLLDSDTRLLHILHGQRLKDYLRYQPDRIFGCNGRF